MYNINPTTAKILINMRKKEEGGLRREGERKKLQRETYKKESKGILMWISSKTWPFICYGE